jgi:hypothetical protein
VCTLEELDAAVADGQLPLVSQRQRLPRALAMGGKVIFKPPIFFMDNHE